MAINISAETRQKEILEVEGVDPLTAKLQGINLMFGAINSIEYCTTMFNFPNLYQLESSYKDKKLPDLSNRRSMYDNIKSIEND